jgi:hypothetical protein
LQLGANRSHTRSTPLQNTQTYLCSDLVARFLELDIAPQKTRFTATSASTLLCHNKTIIQYPSDFCKFFLLFKEQNYDDFSPKLHKFYSKPAQNIIYILVLETI